MERILTGGAMRLRRGTDAGDALRSARALRGLINLSRADVPLVHNCHRRVYYVQGKVAMKASKLAEVSEVIGEVEAEHYQNMNMVHMCALRLSDHLAEIASDTGEQCRCRRFPNNGTYS